MVRLWLIALTVLPAMAQQPDWYVFAHDDGCLELSVLNKRDRLSHTPISPEDYAQMMRAQGKRVIVEDDTDTFPSEFSGKIVNVQLDNTKAVLFVKSDLCKNRSR